MIDSLHRAASLLTAGRHDASEIDWSAISYGEVQALRTALAEQYSPATTNKILSAVRGVTREAWKLGLLDVEEYHRIAAVESIKNRTLPPGRALTLGEVRALFEACGADKFPAAGARDAAMLALLYGAGLRRSEVVKLDLGDYDPQAGEIRIRRGKGRRDRIGHCAGGSRAALANWLRHRGDEPGPLFVRVTQGGNVVQRRLSDDAVWHVVKKRSREAGVRSFSPHSLRRTFITHLLEAGADVGVAQRMAGHANVQTTLRYDRRGEEAQQEAAELLHVPWRASERTG